MVFIKPRFLSPHLNLGCIYSIVGVFRFQSAEVFLNHTQMDPKPMQVDFECACNLERAYG